MRSAAAALALLAAFSVLPGVARAVSLGPTFSIRVPPNVRSTPLTGRAFIFVTRRGAKTEPRLQYHGLGDSIPFFGADVDAVAPGDAITIDADAEGYPLPSLRDLPAGEYDIQALANVYTRFPRADGHVVWAHNDRGEGQQFNISPGNLISEVQHVRIDPRRSQHFDINLDKQIAPIPTPPDTAWVKRVRIQSRLLTAFWGVPMYLGATVLVPRGYDENPTGRYATVYEQGHFDPGAPFGFDPRARMPSAHARAARLARTNRETAYEFTQAWLNGEAPPLVAVLFTHPTPYYDDSYAVNSANNGPYGDALLTELIPYLETHFRLVPHGDARFLIGGSTGGWEALALQIFHPADFNGAWGLYPDPLDFHRFQIGDMYADASAFAYAHNDWIHAEIPAQRNADGTTYATMREESRLELVLGSHGRSAEQFNAWDAAYGPAGSDGYPQEMWDKRSGLIHHAVVNAMRASGFDLEAYLAQRWKTIGPQLTGKLHVDVGDDDSYFLNLACYRMQAFLDAQTAPAANAAFTYGRPMKAHGWQAKTTLNYLKDMAARLPS
ncbi:MAG: alpha/beta hydrolase-fold protein [Candidatus Velthaea sp.]